jgi:MFS family permease
VPYKHFDKVSSLAGGISSLGLVLGPLLGGTIANNGSWRWVFLYKYVYLFQGTLEPSNHNSVPAGIVSWVFILFTLPIHFPHSSPDHAAGLESQFWLATKAFFRRVDILGSFLTLTTCSFIIAALQEGNSEYAWGSGLVVAFFVISGVACIAFIYWEWFICRLDIGIIPMFPWWLARNRVFMGVALYVLLSIIVSSSPDVN